MTTVSITDFRDNLATYLRLVKYEGEMLEIVDRKMGEVMVEINPPQKKRAVGSKIKFTEKMYAVLRSLPKDNNREALKKTDKELIKKRLRK